MFVQVRFITLALLASSLLGLSACKPPPDPEPGPERPKELPQPKTQPQSQAD
jgi:hypothetical protein